MLSLPSARRAAMSTKRRQSTSGGVRKKPGPGQNPKFKYELVRYSQQGDLTSLSEEELAEFKSANAGFVAKWLTDAGAEDATWDSQCRHVLDTIMASPARRLEPRARPPTPPTAASVPFSVAETQVGGLVPQAGRPGGASACRLLQGDQGTDGPRHGEDAAGRRLLPRRRGDGGRGAPDVLERDDVQPKGLRRARGRQEVPHGL